MPRTLRADENKPPDPPDRVALMARIGVVGSINTDLVTTIDRLPAAGETRAAVSFSMERGGKGANQAIAAARNGAAVVFVGAVGDDDNGTDALAALRADKIDVTHVARRQGVATGTATILVEATGQNRIMIAAGANATLSAADIEAAAPLLAACDLILVQLEIPLETVARLIETASSAGVPVLVNPAPATAALLEQSLGTVRFLVPNESELSILTGVLADTDQHIIDSGNGLLKHDIGSIIVTRGEAGVMLIETAGIRVFPTDTVTAIDTTGAGDAFIGGFAAHWATHRDTEAAIAHANRYAALTVTRPGAQSSFPMVTIS